MDLEQKNILERKINYWKPSIYGFAIILLPIIMGVIFIPLVAYGAKTDFNDQYRKEKCLVCEKSVVGNTIKFEVNWEKSWNSIIIMKGSENKINKLNEKYLINNTYTCWIDWESDDDGAIAFKLKDLKYFSYVPYILVIIIVVLMCI